MSVVADLESLAAQVPDGAMVAFPRDPCGAPMAFAKALVRRGARKLHYVGVPSFGMAGDMLIGAGCVATIEAAGGTLGEYGTAPRFAAALRAGTIALKDATCPAIHAALQAGQKGIPFIPLRGLIGSDLVKHRPDWKTIDNPFAAGKDPIVLLPALRPDVAVIHVALADRHGNAWIGRERELLTMAHAARRTLVTAEEIVDRDLLADETMAAGTLPALYVAGVARAERGAAPLGFLDRYAEDGAALADYARRARTADGFAAWLDENVLARRAAA
ncbi:MAG: CoA synthetase [Alphaproteobacteria bacterium]|nr:CoA synthetase [Alphaproteobacteria bacterium]